MGAEKDLPGKAEPLLLRVECPKGWEPQSESPRCRGPCTLWGRFWVTPPRRPFPPVGGHSRGECPTPGFWGGPGPRLPPHVTPWRPRPPPCDPARAHVTPPPPPPARAPLGPAASSPGGPAAQRLRRRLCGFPGRPRRVAARGHRPTLHPGRRRRDRRRPGPPRPAGPVAGLPRRPRLLRTPHPRRRVAAARAGVLPCCSPTWRGGAGPDAEAEAEEEAAAAAAQRGNKASLHTAAEHSGKPAAGKTMRGGERGAERDAPSGRRLDGRRRRANGRWSPLPGHQSQALEASGQSECRERQRAGGTARSTALGGNGLRADGFGRAN